MCQIWSDTGLQRINIPSPVCIMNSHHNKNMPNNAHVSSSVLPPPSLTLPVAVFRELAMSAMFITKYFCIHNSVNVEYHHFISFLPFWSTFPLHCIFILISNVHLKWIIVYCIQYVCVMYLPLCIVILPQVIAFMNIAPKITWNLFLLNKQLAKAWEVCDTEMYFNSFFVWFEQGDGSAVSHCQWTYTGHRKTVLAITFVESLRLAASCDSVVHLWDPFMGSVVAQLDSTRNPPITVLRAMQPPSTSLMAATNDATLRLLDARTCSFVNELKVVKVCRKCSCTKN